MTLTHSEQDNGTEEPQPCPFCESSRVCTPGSENNPDMPGQVRFCVFCLNCSAEGPCHPDKSEAVRLWNKAKR